MTGKNKKQEHYDNLQDAPSFFEGFCPIVPVPKGRPRFRRTGKFVQTYTPKETEEYENAVRKWMQHEYGDLRVPMDGALYARYEFILPRPKSKSKKIYWSDTKPDTDNFVKSFQDGLDFKRKSHDIELGVIANDSRVSCINAIKRYAREDERPGTLFEIRHIDERVIVYSPEISSDALDMLDPSLLKMSIDDVASLSKSCEDTTTILLALGKDGRSTMKEIIAIMKKSFPNLKKVIVAQF